MKTNGLYKNMKTLTQFTLFIFLVLMTGSVFAAQEKTAEKKIDASDPTKIYTFAGV